jgi:hypothetical protein
MAYYYIKQRHNFLKYIKLQITEKMTNQRVLNKQNEEQDIEEKK